MLKEKRNTTGIRGNDVDYKFIIDFETRAIKLFCQKSNEPANIPNKDAGFFDKLNSAEPSFNRALIGPGWHSGKQMYQNVEMIG